MILLKDERIEWIRFYLEKEKRDKESICIEETWEGYLEVKKRKDENKSDQIQEFGLTKTCGKIHIYTRDKKFESLGKWFDTLFSRAITTCMSQSSFENWLAYTSLRKLTCLNLSFSTTIYLIHERQLLYISHGSWIVCDYSYTNIVKKNRKPRRDEEYRSKLFSFGWKKYFL